MARSHSTEPVEWADVQGLLTSDFAELPQAAYVLWRIEHRRSAEAKRWLSDLAARLTVTGTRSRQAVNLALTASAFQKLGMRDEQLLQFSSEFHEGLAPQRSDPAMIRGAARRSSTLGDVGVNSPEHWDWGGWSTKEAVDGLLLLYASDLDSLQQLIDQELERMAGAERLPRCAILRAYHSEYEHFGFRDGISQPIMENTEGAGQLTAREARISVVKPGEFILGYMNERGFRSGLPGAIGARRTTPACARAGDLRRNGTYLVFRQLEQDVAAFNTFVSKTAERIFGRSDRRDIEWVAARFVGRWRSGQPLIEPAAQDASSARLRDWPRAVNDFLYAAEDRSGLACPLGAHIRRANPRDSLGPDPDGALRLSKRHRIIRRSRHYGPKLLPDQPDTGKSEEPVSRGMHFVCLNADIANQFEFIQHAWLNSGVHFAGLHDEQDPLIGTRIGGDAMTIQHRPINLRVEGLPQFVRVRGGAYFFLPGLSALRALAQ